MTYNNVLFRKAVLENVWMPPPDRVVVLEIEDEINIIVREDVAEVYVMEDEEEINIIIVDALDLDIHKEVDELDQDEDLD